MDRELALELERVLRKRFLRWTYALSGISIALSGLLGFLAYTQLIAWMGSMEEWFAQADRAIKELIVIGIGLVTLLSMVMLGLLIISWVEKPRVPVFGIIASWVVFALLGGVLLSPLFYFVGPALILKVFLATGVVFSATGIIAAFIGVDLTRFGGQILAIVAAFVVMGAVNIFLRSEFIEMLWLYGGLVAWLLVAVYAHQLLMEVPMPTPEEVEKGALIRLAIAASVLLYVIFYAIFLRLLLIALSQQKKRR